MTKNSPIQRICHVALIMIEMMLSCQRYFLEAKIDRLGGIRLFTTLYYIVHLFYINIFVSFYSLSRQYETKMTCVFFLVITIVMCVMMKKLLKSKNIFLVKNTSSHFRKLILIILFRICVNRMPDGMVFWY